MVLIVNMKLPLKQKNYYQVPAIKGFAVIWKVSYVTC